MPSDPSSLPVIDVAALTSRRGDVDDTAAAIRRACKECGFFYVVGHDVDEQLLQRLELLSRRFFAQELPAKLSIRMERGGPAWRGYFPVGTELTSGRPDQKEGLYFGAELPDDHPRVAAGVPLHGRNLFPDIPGFRETVLEYLDAMTRLGHRLMEGIALSLGLEASYFADRYTRDPLILFRIFNYPPLASEGADQSAWSVGEHTDYGLLTILRQDETGGLEVKSRSRWIAAPPLPGSFVCNIGDMLDRMTGGRYRSTPHRVRNEGGRARLSFPFFFDPDFDAEVRPIDPQAIIADDQEERWDKASVHELRGTYGEYILGKVSRVFPALRHRPASEEPMTGGVVLRDVTEADLPTFFAQQLDHAANRMAAFTAEDPADREAFAAHWKKILRDDTIIKRTILFEGRVAGHIASFRRSGQPEVTYWIGREHWGRGIATAALSAFLSQVNVRPLYARAARDNVASLRVLQKCGFTICGHDKAFAPARGEEIEEAILILR